MKESLLDENKRLSKSVQKNGCTVVPNMVLKPRGALAFNFYGKEYNKCTVQFLGKN